VFRGVGFNRMRFAEIEEFMGAQNVSIMDMRVVRVYLESVRSLQLFVLQRIALQFYD